MNKRLNCFVDLLLGNVAMMHFAGWSTPVPGVVVLSKKVAFFNLDRFGAAVVKMAHSAPLKRPRPAAKI